MYNIVFNIQFRKIQCSCGFVFAIPEDWAQQKENDHKSFYCPNCKGARHYPQESNLERTKRLLDQERQCCISARKEANYLEKKARGYKGYASKLKKKLVAVK